MPRKAIFWLFTILSLGASAQDSSFLSKAVTGLNAQPAQERVYLHLDKPNYGFGDTIWYRAYTVIGQKHQPSALSGILYVELINSSDSLIARQSIPLVSGIGWSDIPLPFTLKPGSYRLRAYTRWMRNFGPDAFDEQHIVIGGIAPTIVKAADKADVQFFPEGGELVEGVRSRVAVKAVGSNGLGKDIKGTIEDNSGNVVADFATEHLGMGVFAIVPEAGKSYRARINIPGETAFTIDLLKAKPLGYTLSVNNNERDSIYVKLATNDKTLAADKNKTFYIIAQSNGKACYTTQGKLEGTVYTADIAKSRFPEGIVQFTLFSQNGEPLAERIAFIENKADELNISLNADKQGYSTRDKVTLNLVAKDSINKPVTGSFSVAVINETKVNPDENSENTILNNLLLSSELKGYIEQPNYYFTNTNDKTRSDLDLLMLTQGYRRYEWEQILNSSPAIQQYPPEHTQELSGTITRPGGEAIPNGKVTLLATKQGLARDTTADENGKFTFTGLNITDITTVVIRARKTNNGSNVKIKAFVPDYPKITPAEYIAGDIIPADSVQLTSSKTQYDQYRQEQKSDSLKNGVLLNEVTIKDKKPRKADEFNGYGAFAEYDADMKKLVQEQVVTGRALTNVIPGLTYSIERGFYYNQMPVKKVIIDGLIASKPDAVDFVSVRDLESVRVIGIKPPVLVLITKRYAGTDTQKTAGQLEYEQQQKAYLQKNGKMLNTVTIKGVKPPKKPDLQFSSNLNEPGHADQVLMADQIGDGCINLSDCLPGKLVGVIFKGEKAYSMRTQNRLGGQPAMTVIIDGVILGPSHINDISPTSIYSIEVLRSGGLLAIYGSNAAGGAIIITTKRGGETKSDTMRTTGQLQYAQYEQQQKAYFQKDGKMLKTVTIKGNKLPQKPNLQFSSNLNGPGHADQVLMWNQLGDGCIRLSDCLYGKLAGVILSPPASGVGSVRKAYLQRAMNRLSGKLAMTVIIDGMIMGPEHLDDVSPNDIYSIEILRSGGFLALYGSNAPGGAIIITTKRGGEGTAYFTQAQPNGIMTFPFAGFHKTKTFYVPKYGSPKKDNEAADTRSTVYWNPNILTDKDGKATLEFYNNDSKGVYRVVIEGIDDDGKLGRQLFRYVVN